MKRHGRLFFRIWLAMLAAVAVTAVIVSAAWRQSFERGWTGGDFTALAVDIAGELLPPANAEPERAQITLARWRERLGVDLALHDASGAHIAATPRAVLLPAGVKTSGWLRRHGAPHAYALRLTDGRWLVASRTGWEGRPPLRFMAMLAGIAAILALLAWLVARRLTRRLERLQASVEALGQGNLSARVRVRGHDEIAALGRSFNQAAARIEALVTAQKSLLANASHELRSPLARLRMAVERLQAGADASTRAHLRQDIAELDQLIDEIILASRLDAGAPPERPFEMVDLTGLVAEECARTGADLDGAMVSVHGDPVLLRRMVRNLLENARRHGGGAAVEVQLSAVDGSAGLAVCDRGPGVPAEERDRIFEPFYRLAGASERAGGVGLGLALVRRIATAHQGAVVCLPRDGGGACFRVTLPSVPTAAST